MQYSQLQASSGIRHPGHLSRAAALGQRPGAFGTAGCPNQWRSTRPAACTHHRQTKTQTSWGTGHFAASECSHLSPALHRDPASRQSPAAQQCLAAASAALPTPAVDLSNATEDELQHHAREWGFSQVGRPLPEGASTEILAQAVPAELYRSKPEVSLGHILTSSGIMAAGYWIQHHWHSILPLHLQLASWMLIGVGYFGLFILATEAAMFRLLPETPTIQDIIGVALITPSLYAYETVRLKAFSHMLAPNMLGKDKEAAWHPFTVADVQQMGARQLAALRLLWGTPLKLLASIAHWLSSWDGFDLKRYTPLSRVWMLLSWAMPFAFVGTVFPAIIAAGGLGALFNWWLMPWLVFHCCLSTMTLARNTAPHIPFRPFGLQYDEGQAALGGCVTLLLPKWMQYIVHNFNYTAVQQVASSVPFHSAPDAHEALRQRLGPYLTEAQPSLGLLKKLIYKWQVYDPQQETYVTIDQALAQEPQQQVQQQGEQQQEAGGNGSSSSSSSGGRGAGSQMLSMQGSQ